LSLPILLVVIGFVVTLGMNSFDLPPGEADQLPKAPISPLPPSPTLEPPPCDTSSPDDGCPTGEVVTTPSPFEAPPGMTIEDIPRCDFSATPTPSSVGACDARGHGVPMPQITKHPPPVGPTPAP
jgi:hypothetical protein